MDPQQQQPQARPEQQPQPPLPPPPPPPLPRPPPPLTLLLATPTGNGRVAVLRIKPGAAALGTWTKGGPSPPGTPSKAKGQPPAIARGGSAAAPPPPPPPPPAAPNPASLPPPPPPPCPPPGGPRVSLPAPILLLWSSGLACGLISALLSVGGNLLVKLLAAPPPPLMQIVLMRALTSLLLTLALAALAGTKPLTGHKPTRPYLLARGSLGAMAMALWYVSLEHLPLGDAVVISLCGPPLTALLALLLLREPLGWLGMGGCLAAFAGVVVVSQPPFLFGRSSDQDEASVSSSGPAPHALGVLAGVLAALATSSAMIAIRKIGGSEPAIVVTLAFHVCSAAMGAASLLVGLPAPPQHPSARNAWLLVATGAVTFLAQLLVTRSFQLLPAAAAAALAFSGVVYAFVAGAVFFGERITLAAALGTALITVGVALVTLRPKPAVVAVVTAAATGDKGEVGAAAVAVAPAPPSSSGIGGVGSSQLPLAASRRRLITQHSITACGDGGALFGTDLFVAVEPPPPTGVAPAAAVVTAAAAAAATGGSGDATTTPLVSPFAAPSKEVKVSDEPTALEALAADPLVVAASRLVSRSFRRQGTSSVSRGGSSSLLSASMAAAAPRLMLRQLSSLVRWADREAAAEAAVAAAAGPAPEGASLPLETPEPKS